MSRRFWLFIILFSLIFPVTGQNLPSYVPTNGLVGWWPFDGNANDISGNGNHGTVNGATLTTDRYNSANSAYYFDGINDFINLGGLSVLSNSPDSYTQLAWLKFDDFSDSRIIGTKRNSSGGWATPYALDTALMFYADDAGYTGANIGYTTSIDTGNYYFLCFVKDFSSYTIYLNGVLVDSMYDTHSISPTSSDYYVGAHSAWNKYMKGTIDCFGLWNRALNNSEIEQMYSAIVPCTETTIAQSDTTICFGDPITLSLDVFDQSNYTYLGSSNTSKYYIDNANIGWTDSRNAAVAAGADLVVIEDSNEQNLIYSLISSPTIANQGIDGYHIGFYQDLQSSSYSEPSGGWTWVNGNSTYTNWEIVQPSNSGPCQAEHWAMMWNNGTWNDECDGIWSGNELRGIIEVPIYPSVSNLSWSTGSTQGFITVSPTQSSTYWIETVENGKVCRDSIQVSINHPQISVTNPTSCGNASDSSLMSLSGFMGQKLTPIDSIEGTISTNWSKQIATAPGQDYVLEISGLFTYGTYCPSLVTDPAYGLAGFYGRTSPQPRGISPDVSGLYVLGDTLTRPSPDIYNSTSHTYYYPFTASGNSITVGWYDSGSGDNCGSASFKLSKVNQSTLWSTGQTEDEIWVKPNVSTNYWVAQTLGNSTCTTNASVNILPKTIVGGDTTVCEGTELTLSGSGGFSLNGANNYIALEKPGPIGQTQRSFSVWFKTTATNDMTIFGYGDLGCNASSVQLRLNHNANYSAAYVGTYCPYVTGLAAVHGCRNGNFDVTVSDGEWHHAAYVMGRNNNYAVNKIELYLDGQLVSNNSGCFHNWNGNSFNTGSGIPITIGKQIGVNNGFFVGEIDDLAIFDTAITSTQIQDIYSNGIDLNDSHLSNYFNFENIVGDSIFDLKGDNHGKIYGALNPSASAAPNSGMSYLWSTGDTTGSITFTANNSASYWLRTTSNGVSCFDTIHVTVLPSKIIASDSLYCSTGDSALLYINSSGLSTISSSSSLTGSLTNGLVAWYPFNGNANDESGNGNHGIVFGPTLSNDRSNNPNSSYRFNGGTDLIATTTQLGSTNTYTVSFWVQFDQISAAWLVMHGGTQTGAISYNFDDGARLISDGTIKQYVYNGTQNWIGSNNVQANNQWYHIVYSLSPSGMKMFINGALSHLEPNVTTSQAINGYWRIGGCTHPGHISLFGSLDDIGIWNRELSQSEITSLYNQPNILWSTTETNDSIYIPVDSTIQYYVVTSQNGTTCSDSVTISVNQGIQASDTTICYGENVTLSTISGQSAIWSTGDTASSITVNPATTTKYWATTSYGGGTCSDTLTVFVNAPKINSNDLYSCAPQDSVLLYNSNHLNSACSPLQGSLALNSNGWYPFCGNSEDLSSSQNNAIVNGAVLTDDRLGGTNSAYYFDGVGDYLKIFNNASNNYGTSSISMAAWVKIPTVSNPQQAPIIGNYISTTTAAFNLMVGGANELNPGKLNFFARNSSGAEMNLWSTTRIDDDQWHHVAIVRNSTNDSAFLYIDGTINRKSAIASGSFDSFQGFVIGGAHLNRYLKCTIDEIATWRRALSSSEIHQLATQAPSISNWSTGQSTDSIWVKPTQTTTYWIEQSLNGVTCTDSATAFINKVNIEPSLPTICNPGDSVLLYAPGVEQGFDEPNCNSGYVGLRPTYTPGESINGYSYKGMYNGHHYYLANSPGSWTDAAAAAKIAGGHLVCIDDANEQNFVANLSTGNLWLGYYRTPTNAWAWVNCQTSTYTNWRSGEPGTSEPYAHIITDNCSYNGGANQWNDIGNLSNNGVCYSNCYGVLEIDPDEIGFGQNSQVLNWSNVASNDSIWLTPNQDGDYWLTSYVNGEGCSDTVSLRVLNPAITAPTTTSCSPGDSVMLYYSGNREFVGLDTIAVPDQLIGQVTKPMTALWNQSWNVTPNQTYIMKVSGLYDVCCGSQGCLDAAFLTLNCYSQSQQSASNPCSSGGWWIFNDDCGIRPDNDVYNPSHEYYYTFENSDGTIDLSFSDNVGDNSGSLTFTLYSTKQKVVRTYNDTITWSTGESSDTIWVTPTTTSTYSVTASRGGVNCLESIQIDVTTLSNFDPLIPTRIHCQATNTVLDGTDASAITYSWSTGTQASSTTVNTSGQYWVQATDNLGCSFSDTTQVWLSNIQSNLSSIEPTCYGFSNGSITPNPSGGISNYSYLWSNGDTTAALSATASGLHWVTITDSVGCSVQDSILLDQPSDLAVTAAAISDYNGFNIPCFGGLNGQALATVSGGTLPYTYSWSNGSPDSIVYSLAAGTHTVNIMDSNGCITSDTVLITQPTGINTSLSSTSSYNGFDISCYGIQDGSIQLAVSGGVTPYQHYWNNGANGTSVSNIGAGLYTVNTVDANGCSSVDSITLNQPNVLTSTATIVSNYNGYNVSCYGASDGSAQISAIGGNAPYTYSWSNGATSNQNNGISAGSYSVTVMDTNGCSVQDSVVLNEPTELQITTSVTSNFNGYPISCTGANDGSAMVNSNGGTAPYTILWSNGDTSLTTINLSAGTYFVTVTDANGCSKSDSVVLTDPIGLSNLILSASSYNGFNISCSGGNDGNISMTGVNGGTAPLSYYWNTGDSTSSITGVPAGNFTLTVTDINGCSISDSLTLNQPTLLTSNASATSNYNGTNISCNGAMDGSAQVSSAGGVGPHTFLWNTSDTSSTIANLSAGTYTVVVTDANGCSTMDTVSLNEPSLFTLSAGVQSNYNGYNISCAGGADGQVAALANGGTGPYSYNWSNGSSSPGQNNLAAGTYIINATDANGCSAADTLTLIEPSALSSIASVTSNYNGYNVSCQGAQDGSATVNAQGGVTPYTINWSNGSSGAIVSNLGAGVHTVTIQDANGCSTNASVNLTEPGGVSVTATSSPASCFGATDGSASITVAGGTGNFDIQWSNGGTGLNQTGLTSNWYTYIISTSPNCFLTDSIWVDQPEPLVIQVDTVPPTCISAFDGEINVVAFGGTPGYQYFLNGNAFSGFQDELGTDSLEIVAVDMNNCDTTLILAMPAQTQSCLFIPNWFTPNGNNQEDAWRIEGFEYENLRLKVFNVMGQLIYTTESSTYIPWDGNYNGSPLPEGDYYYLIESTVNDSKYSGYVTLLR